VLQDSATDSYYESNQFSLQPYILFKLIFNIILPSVSKFFHIKLSL